MKPRIERLRKLSGASYVLAALGVVLVTAMLVPLRGAINSTTVGFAFLLLVLFIAIYGGSKPALLSSALGVLSFNFFFLPSISNTSNR
jgi:K+-sensing histidine kinase KdpD